MTATSAPPNDARPPLPSPRLLVTALLLLWLPATARAQSQSPSPQGEAGRLLSQSVRAFQSDHYDTAYQKAHAAYALSNDPDALFVEAQALYACWDFQMTCAEGGTEGNRKRAQDAFTRFIALVESDRALIRKSGEDLDMAKNHKLELEEAARDATAVRPRGKAETDELLRRAKLSLLRRQADRDYLDWRSAPARDERKETAGEGAIESYQGIVELLKGEDADSLDLALKEVARQRIKELKRDRTNRQQQVVAPAPAPPPIVAPAPPPPPPIVVAPPAPEGLTPEPSAPSATNDAPHRKKSKLWVLGVVAGVVAVGVGVGVGLAYGLHNDAPLPNNVDATVTF